MNKTLKTLLITGTTLGVFSVAGLFGYYSYLSRDLPDVAQLKDINYNQQLVVYDRNGIELQNYGNEKRVPLEYDQFPEQLRNAVIAIEDRRFFEHDGVDFRSIGRAVFSLVSTGEKSQGASTITQQVARNFFLNNKKEFTRKFKEIILAIKMEKELTKEEILALYMNKIFLGHRSYGFAAAAKTYFNKDVNDLTLLESAVLAGLPQAPSTANPRSNPQAAKKRAIQVLDDMKELGFITQEQYLQAVGEELIVASPRNKTDDSYHIDSYIAELVRNAMYDTYGEEAYTSGYEVYTTIDINLQREAEKAIRANLAEYDRRHGYRGATDTIFEGESPYSDEELAKIIQDYPTIDPIYPVVVKSAGAKSAQVINADGNLLELNLESVKWARKHINNARLGPTPTAVNQVVKAGEIIYIYSELKGDRVVNTLTQIPAANSGLVSLDSRNGAIQALVGGYSYTISKFNRATQSAVQVGSTIKPFIYSFALENGYNLGDVLSDAPIAYRLSNSTVWQPKNYNNSYGGRMTLRQALAQSRNSIAVKLMLDENSGYQAAGNYLTRFGFQPGSYAITPSLALGTANFTPLEMARAYAVFANGGFLVDPYLINEIRDKNGQTIYRANPLVACDNCPDSETPVVDVTANGGLSSHKSLMQFEVINDPQGLKQPVDAKDDSSEVVGDKDPTRDNIKEEKATINIQKSDNSDKVRIAPRVISREVAWLMNSALNSNVFGGPGYSGTGAAAKSLGRTDIGGKTGTTNNSRAAWFVGYGGPYTTAVFVAFDNNIELGQGEAGGRTALPAWIQFEKYQLRDVKAFNLKTPEKIVQTRINPNSGCLDNGGIVEYFIEGRVPQCLASYTVKTTQEVEEVEGGDGYDDLGATDEVAPPAPKEESPAPEEKPAQPTDLNDDKGIF